MQPLQKKQGRKPFCGVERYNARRDRLCGVELYKSARSSACGVESYKAAEHISCPGSVARDEKVFRTSGSCPRSAPAPASCPSGYEQTKHHKEVERCHNGRLDIDWEITVSQTRVCLRRQRLPTCRKPEFGVELYRSCRHSFHGVERWKSCERPEFGTVYKSCSYYVETAAELRQYIDQTRPLIGIMGMTLIDQAAIFYTHVNDERGMACLIGRYENDPLHEDVILDLKYRYEDTFGRPYQPQDCSEDAPVASIESYACTEDDRSSPCRAKRTYESSKSWLTVKGTDLDNLIQDHLARGDQRLKRELQELRAEIASYAQ